MKLADQIPFYAPDGSSMGFRTLEAARRLIAGGYVKPAYGRKGHLKAIWLVQRDLREYKHVLPPTVATNRRPGETVHRSVGGFPLPYSHPPASPAG